MTFMEASRTIAGAWVPGAMDYFAQFKQDPWEQNLSDLENQIKNPNVFGPPDFKGYAERALNLLERFKRDAVGSNKLKPIDGLILGMGEGTYQSAESRIYRQCRSCESAKALRPYKVSSNSTNVELLCDSCAALEKKRN